MIKKTTGKKARRRERIRAKHAKRTLDRYAVIEFLGLKRHASVTLLRLMEAEKRLGLIPPEPGEPYSSQRGRTLRCVAEIRERGLIREQKTENKQPMTKGTFPPRVTKATTLHKSAPSTPDDMFTTAAARRFYASWEWRKLRYTIILKYGRVCMCCGDCGPDVQINVDHIKPMRRYWHLRRDPNNLQILCAACNHGKGAWDETDHRPELVAAVRPRVRLCPQERTTAQTEHLTKASLAKTAFRYDVAQATGRYKARAGIQSRQSDVAAP